MSSVDAVRFIGSPRRVLVVRVRPSGRQVAVSVPQPRGAALLEANIRTRSVVLPMPNGAGMSGNPTRF